MPILDIEIVVADGQQLGNELVAGEIADAAYRTQQQVESQELVVVGVNRFQDAGPDASIPLHRLNEAAVAEQKERLGRLRAERDQARTDATLAAVTETAVGTDNLIPNILDAVEAMATLGEISDAMRRVFGEHRGQA